MWNTAGISVALDVDPPPWRSTWAYLTHAALALLAAFAIWMQIRLRLVVKHTNVSGSNNSFANARASSRLTRRRWRSRIAASKRPASPTR